MKQLEIHKRIDEFLKGQPTQANPTDLTPLISDNADARQYFFSVADARWLNWLWTNGFLDSTKEAPESIDSYNFRTPEISYLAKVASAAPEEVTAIVLNDELATTKDKFRPELIDQILRLCESLPAAQLARVVPKIHAQEWTKIMAPFSRWGFEYEKLFKILAESGDYKTLLILADSVLAVRSAEESGKKKDRFSSDNPFYFHELSYTKVFEYLVNVPNEFAEEVFALVSQILGRIVVLGGNAEAEDVFPVRDSFYLFDVDFFTLEPKSKESLSYRDDVRELVAVAKKMADKLIGSSCGDEDRARDYFARFIQTLPDSRAMWRFRLYALSLCPDVFAAELRSAFFRLFEVEAYHDIMSDTEYEKALEKGFRTLSVEDRESYVDQVISYFTRKSAEHPDQNWHKRHGSELLTMIGTQLTDPQKEKATVAGFTFIKNYKPSPAIGEVMGGVVHTRGPITQEEFDQLPLAEIAEKLRGEWTPRLLHEKYKNDDFMSPRNAEGAGELIRNGAPKRLEEYVSNANLFFDRNIVDAHYTHSYYRGIEEAIKNNRSLAQTIDWEPLINAILVIADSGTTEPFKAGHRERESGDGWLSGWDSVHSSIADVMQALLREEGGKLPVDFTKHRDALLKVVEYLLTYPDPVPKDEVLDTASMKVSSGGEPQLVGDPFSMAINSARGRAFQAFVLFIYPDGKRFDSDATVRLAEDVKEVYERTLRSENTRAIMFMFGHYLPQFYFRDIKWSESLFPEIFPEATDKVHLYLAAWEGYLANNLYREMFENPLFQRLYMRGLEIEALKEQDRRYFRDIDEGIATHIALAFIHYDDARYDHPLFKKLWAEGSTNQQKEFVAFIGKSVVSGSNNQIDEFLKENPSVKELLKTLWDWILEHQTKSELFLEFGFWANLQKGVFDAAWLARRLRLTLEKTKGVFDWDYGLTQICIELSKAAPEDTLQITKLFFIDGGIKAGHQRRPYYVDREWFDVFKNLIQNPDTKNGTIDLIDELIREGGNPFWGLKTIVDEG